MPWFAPGFGWGRGRGWRWCWWFGFPGGRGWGWKWWWLSQASGKSFEELERDWLKAQSQVLKRYLDLVEKRLADLEAKQEKNS